MARELDAQLLASKLEKQDRLLMLDIRPFLQFNKGHIRGAVNLPCSPLMLRRLEKNGHGLKEYVPADLRDRLYASNSSSASELSTSKSPCGEDSGVTVLVYDGQSSQIIQGKPLCVVFSALEKDLPQIYFLAGGYDAFSAAFPQLCDTSLVTRRPCTCKERNGQCFVCQRAQPPLSAPISSPLRSSLSLDRAFMTSRRALVSQGENHTRTPQPTSDSGLGDDQYPSEVQPFLRLGSSRHSSERALLRSLGITAILNVSANCPNYFEDELLYKNIPVDDTLGAKILPWLDEAISFIERVRQDNGCVLVHCAAGISRSSTVCIAYLMLTKHLSLMESYDFVKVRRTAIAPNINFMGQLLQFEEMHNLNQKNGKKPSPLLPRQNSKATVSATGAAYVDTDIEGLSGILSQLKFPPPT